MGMQEDIRRLMDLEAIRDLARRYAHCVWIKDPAGAAALFVEDCVMDTGGPDPLLELELELHGIDSLRLGFEHATPEQLVFLLEDRVVLLQLRQEALGERVLLGDRLALLAFDGSPILLGLEQRLESAGALCEEAILGVEGAVPIGKLFVGRNHPPLQRARARARTRETWARSQDHP